MLEYKLDTLDGVDEETTKLYKKTGNVYVLDLKGKEVENLEGIRTALDKERARADNAEKEAKESAKKLRDSSKKARDDADAAARAAGDIEKVESNLHAHYKEEIETRDATIARQGKKINEVLLRDGALNIALDRAVDPDSAPALAEWIENRMEVVEDGDDYKLVGKDGFAGLTPEQIGGKIGTEKSLARLLKASSGSGGGATNPKGGGAANTKTATREEFDAMSPDDKMTFSKEGGEINSDS